MTTPRIVKQFDAATLGVEDARLAPVSFVPLGAGGPVKPLSVLAGTRDYGQVLHQIRALLTFACTALAAVVLLLAVVVDHLKSPRPGTMAEFPAPAAVVLSLTGDPALDYFAHVELADGTQRDVQLGAHLLDSPVRIVLHANSADGGETTCRIALDGVLVATESSSNGGTATCEWRAEA